MGPFLLPMTTQTESKKLIRSLKKHRGEPVTYYTKDQREIPNVTVVIDHDTKVENTNYQSKVSDRYITALIEVSDVGYVAINDELQVSLSESYKINRILKNDGVIATVVVKKVPNA